MDFASIPDFAAVGPDSADHGMTDAEWTFNDAVCAAVSALGAERLIVAIWSAHHLPILRMDDAVGGRLELLIDKSFPSRAPPEYAKIKKALGSRARCWNGHGKLAVCESWAYVSSGNPQLHPLRCETWWFGRGAESARYFGFLSALFDALPESPRYDDAAISGLTGFRGVSWAKRRRTRAGRKADELKRRRMLERAGLA